MIRPARRSCPGPVGQLSYLSWPGRADLEPLVLLHPVNTAGAVWVDLMDHLARAAVAVDYRGHGASQRIGPFGPGDYAADALAVMDSAGISSGVLVGASVGGAVAAELTRAHPERVSGIALLGAALRFGTAAEAMDEVVAELHKLGTDEWFGAHAGEILGPAAPSGVVDRVVELAGGRPETLVEAILRATFVEADSRPAAADVRASGPPASWVATGSHDPTCPLAAAEELAGYLGCTALVLEGLGHLPMLESPLDTARHLQSFLEADVDVRTHCTRSDGMT